MILPFEHQLSIQNMSCFTKIISAVCIVGVCSRMKLKMNICPNHFEKKKKKDDQLR